MSSLKEYNQEADLRRALDSALRRLEKARVSKEELVDAVYRASLEAAAALSLKRVDPPKPDKRKGNEEVAIALLSDWQLAKLTPNYNSDVCEERIERYADKLVELATIQRNDHPVRELRVWLLGDIVEGELIFPGQQHLIDASLYRQVMVDGPRILTNFLRRMLSNFERVRVTGVIGNHGALGGRARRDYNPESNADRMLYRGVHNILGPDGADEGRIEWNIPDGGGERNWYAIEQVGAKRWLLFHGDQIRGGFAGFPFYGLGKKVYGWHAGAIPEGPFDYAALGHWHQAASIPLNKMVAWVNGSTESMNTYAAEQLAAASDPCQWLLFAREDGMVSAEYRVWLS